MSDDSKLLATVLALVDAHEKTLTGLSNYPDFIKSDTQQKTRDALVAELRWLCEDRERLDFLESARCELEHGSYQRIVYPATPNQSRPACYGTCLREGIDEAREFVARQQPPIAEPAHHDG